MIELMSNIKKKRGSIPVTDILILFRQKISRKIFHISGGYISSSLHRPPMPSCPGEEWRLTQDAYSHSCVFDFDHGFLQMRKTSE